MAGFSPFESVLGHAAFSKKAAIPTIPTSHELGDMTWVLNSGSGGTGNEVTGTVHPGGSTGLHQGEVGPEAELCPASHRFLGAQPKPCREPALTP